MITTANILLFIGLAFGIGVFYYMSTLPVVGEDEEEDHNNAHNKSS